MQVAQLGQARGEVAARRHGSSSASAAVERDVELQRGLAPAPGVEVWRARSASSSQASAASRPPSSAAEALLRAQRRVAARARRAAGGQLARLRPAPVGHLLALAVADADDERLLAARPRARTGRRRRRGACAARG